MHLDCAFFKIYLLIAPTCFGYSLAIIRVLVIWYSGRTMCIFYYLHTYLHKINSITKFVFSPYFITEQC